MKRNVLIVVVLAVLLFLLGVLVFVIKSSGKKAKLPAQVKIELPSGEVVTAYNMTTTPPVPPSGTRLVLSGRVVKEKDDIDSIQLVLVTDIGEKYVLIGSPYREKLEKEAISKQAKVKGLSVSKTTFKEYPALLIEDIIDIY